MSLALFRPKYEDSFCTHLKGVDQELNPSFVYLDQLEGSFEKRAMYPEIFEVLKVSFYLGYFITVF